MKWGRTQRSARIEAKRRRSWLACVKAQSDHELLQSIADYRGVSQNWPNLRPYLYSALAEAQRRNLADVDLPPNVYRVVSNSRDYYRAQGRTRADHG